MPGYFPVQDAPADPDLHTSIHYEEWSKPLVKGHKEVSIAVTRQEIGEICGEACKRKGIRCPTSECTGRPRTDGYDKSGSYRLKCLECHKSYGPKKVLAQLAQLYPEEMKRILFRANTKEILRMDVDLDIMENMRTSRGLPPMTPKTRASIKAMRTCEIPEELIESQVNLMERLIEMDQSEQLTRRQEDIQGKEIVPTNKQMRVQVSPSHQQTTNRFTALRDEMNMEQEEDEYEEGEMEEELSPKQKRALLEIEETSKMMEQAKETIAILAERQRIALREYGYEDAPEGRHNAPNAQYITRNEFEALERKIDTILNMIQSSKQVKGVTPPQAGSMQTPSMANRIAEAERMRQEGLVVLRNDKGETYGVKPEVLEAKTRRQQQTQRPAVIHVKGFKGLRYKETRGLMTAYGINNRDIIAMSYMGPYAEIVVAGEAKEEIAHILTQKGYTIDDVDVFEGSPLKLNVDASVLSPEIVQELRRKAAKEARAARWNKIIAQIPKEMTRKRALLARVRDGRMAELQKPMMEEAGQRPEKLTRLDQMIMLRIEEEMKRREAITSSSDSDGENVRRRKIAGRSMQVTPTQGVTQSQ